MLLGFPLADPIVGLIISAAIVVLLIGTVRSIGTRLLDGIDPALLTRAETSIAGSPGVQSVERVQLRWLGHRLNGTAVVIVQNAASAPDVAAAVRQALGRDLPNFDDIVIEVGFAASGAVGK